MEDSVESTVTVLADTAADAVKSGNLVLIGVGVAIGVVAVIGGSYFAIRRYRANKKAAAAAKPTTTTETKVDEAPSGPTVAENVTDLRRRGGDTTS